MVNQTSQAWRARRVRPARRKRGAGRGSSRGRYSMGWLLPRTGTAGTGLFASSDGHISLSRLRDGILRMRSG